MVEKIKSSWRSLMIRFLFISYLFFLPYCYGYGQMSGTTIYGYLDNDSTKDNINCGMEDYDEINNILQYQCQITTSKINIKWSVINNGNCRYYNISPSIKGEFYIECGIWGQNEISYYQYDNQLKNWFLYKKVKQYGAMDGPDSVPKPDEVTILQEQWSIDKHLLKMTYNNDFIKFIQLIKNKYDNKLFSEILAIAKANKISIKLTLKTVLEYNNLAFYYQQAGANLEAVTILKNIIEAFPERRVAYLNLADAYLSLDLSSDALFSYQKYVSLMKAANKQDKIPKRVWEYLNTSAISR
jgi:hypothetical protein